MRWRALKIYLITTEERLTKVQFRKSTNGRARPWRLFGPNFKWAGATRGARLAGAVLFEPAPGGALARAYTDHAKSKVPRGVHPMYPMDRSSTFRRVWGKFGGSGVLLSPSLDSRSPRRNAQKNPEKSAMSQFRTSWGGLISRLLSILPCAMEVLVLPCLGRLVELIPVLLRILPRSLPCHGCSQPVAG
jgi:hypothetical protein